jgi:hypothetical protein
MQMSLMNVLTAFYAFWQVEQRLLNLAGIWSKLLEMQLGRGKNDDNFVFFR